MKTMAYTVRRDPNTNPIYHMFDWNSNELEVSPGENLELNITYAPTIPHQKNLDYFHVLDNLNNGYIICLKGECIGKKVSLYPFRLLRLALLDCLLPNKSFINIKVLRSVF